MLPNCWSILGGGGPKLFLTICQRPKRFRRPLCKKTGRRFQLSLSVQIPLLRVSQTKVELHRNWVFFQPPPLQQRRFILHFPLGFLCSYKVLFCTFILRHQNPILSGDRNSGLRFATWALSMLSQSNIPSCWSGTPPKSVIVGIKQIKIDFYSAGSDFTEIMAA